LDGIGIGIGRKKDQKEIEEEQIYREWV